MISVKVPSSPTLFAHERTIWPNSEHRSEPSDLTDLGQQPSVDTVSSVSKSADAAMGSNKESNESSTKAEFYIGDEGVVQTPTLPEAQPFGLLVKQVKNLEVEIAIPAKDETATKSRGALVPEFVAPDGGFGWVVAFSACVINLFIVGFIKSYGVLYVSIKKTFPEATAYQASWLPVFLSTTGLLMAPGTGILCRKFTSRKVSFVGGIFAFTGILLGAISNSMLQMIFTFGLFTGIGAGLTTTPAVLITSLYFEKRRSLASAICVSGNAIGGFLFPPLTEIFLTNYGLRGTLYIMAALQLHICAASMFFRPIRLHALIQHKQKQKQRNRDRYLTYEESKTLVSPVDEPRIVSGISRQGSLLKRVIMQSRIPADSMNAKEEEELRYQVSFLRSCSMVNSVPDLTEYARSWSFDQGSTMNQYPSFKAIYKGSKSSFINMVTKNKSITELDGSHPSLGAVESQPLTREFSRRMRQKMPSVLELESDSHTSLSDLANIETTQPPLAEPQSNPDNRVSDSVYIDQNLNIKAKCRKVKPPDKSDDEARKTPRKTKGPSTGGSKFFDRTLFQNSALWLMSATVAFMATGAPHALFFLPAYATSVEIDQAAVIYIMSISSVVDLIGRLGTGFISDMKILRSSLLYAVLQSLAGVSLLMLPLTTTITGVGILLSLYGLGVGGWFVLIPALLAEHHGVQKLAASYGIVRMFQGIMNFISPQVSGLIIDVSESYASIYFFMGTCMAFGGTLMLMEPCLDSAKKRKRALSSRNI